VVSTATIAGARDHLRQLGIGGGKEPLFLPSVIETKAFFEDRPEELKHEVLALIPFDVVLTRAIPDLLDAFFETLYSDYGFDACSGGNTPPPWLGHLRQVMVYCSSYANIYALQEMNRNAIEPRRERQGRPPLREIQLSSRYFSRESAQRAIENVRNQRQQIVYATNIASIGIDIENLDVIWLC
jgi:hypothetical protein